jgi:hypothetical protein
MPRVRARESDRLMASKAGGFEAARLALRLHIAGPALSDVEGPVLSDVEGPFTQYGSQGAT